MTFHSRDNGFMQPCFRTIPMVFEESYINCLTVPGGLKTIDKWLAVGSKSSPKPMLTSRKVGHWNTLNEILKWSEGRRCEALSICFLYLRQRVYSQIYAYKQNYVRYISRWTRFMNWNIYLKINFCISTRPKLTTIEQIEILPVSAMIGLSIERTSCIDLSGICIFSVEMLEQNTISGSLTSFTGTDFF